GPEPALRRRGLDLRRVRRGRRDDRGREVLRPRLCDLAGRDVDADGDDEGPDGRAGRLARQGRAAGRDRRAAHAGAAQVRDARPHDAEGRAAQGQGNAAPRRPRRLRRPGTDLVPDVVVAVAGEFPPGSTKIVREGSLFVGVYNCGGELYAIEDRCSHDDGPLCEGDWDEERCCVVCPRHGSQFELSTGRPISLPATDPVETYPVRVVDGTIVLALP